MPVPRLRNWSTITPGDRQFAASTVGTAVGNQWGPSPSLREIRALTAIRGAR
jgi:hypothetical protein